MARTMRLFSLVLCAVALFMFALPMLAAVAHAGHTCADVRCEVCACITGAAARLKYLSAGLTLLWAARTALRCMDQSLARGRVRFSLATPVALATQLNR